MSGQQKSVVYEFNVHSLTECRLVNIFKCCTRNLNSYNKSAVRTFLRELRTHPTSLFLDFE